MIFIPGTPAPKGSTKSFSPKGTSKVITTNANESTKPWQATVSGWVRESIGPRILYPRPAAVDLAVEFVMPRVKSEPKTTRAHTKKPDIDKLARCVLDALTGLVYDDDTQVTSFTKLLKRTAEVGEQPGLWLEWQTTKGVRIEIEETA